VQTKGSVLFQVSLNPVLSQDDEATLLASIHDLLVEAKVIETLRIKTLTYSFGDLGNHFQESGLV
jgi:hypothetical protein